MCRRTLSRLPPFVLVLKRYAAALIQGVWEDRINGFTDGEAKRAASDADRGQSLEQLTERWGLPCVITVWRWLAPLEDHAQSLEAELRRLLPEGSRGHVEVLPTPGERLLSLAQLVPIHVPHHPLDRDRVPYHHVLSFLGRLHVCNG